MSEKNRENKLHQEIPPGEKPTPAPEKKQRLEILAREKSTPAHLLAGAKALRGWDDSTDVGEAELQAAIAEVLSIRIG